MAVVFSPFMPATGSHKNGLGKSKVSEGAWAEKFFLFVENDIGPIRQDFFFHINNTFRAGMLSVS